MLHIESQEQKAVIAWARLWAKQYPCLNWLHSSLNGFKFNNLKIAQRAKAEGMTAGIPDLFLPFPNKNYNGLYIEMKRPYIKGEAKPTLSEAQKQCLEYLNNVGYKAIVCYGSKEAIEVIKSYII